MPAGGGGWGGATWENREHRGPCTRGEIADAGRSHPCFFTPGGGTPPKNTWLLKPPELTPAL